MNVSAVVGRANGLYRDDEVYEHMRDCKFTASIYVESIPSKGWTDELMCAGKSRYKLVIHENAKSTTLSVESPKDVSVVVDWLRQMGGVRVWNHTNNRNEDFGIERKEVIEK